MTKSAKSKELHWTSHEYQYSDFWCIEKINLEFRLESIVETEHLKKAIRFVHCLWLSTVIQQDYGSQSFKGYLRLNSWIQGGVDLKWVMFCSTLVAQQLLKNLTQLPQVL